MATPSLYQFFKKVEVTDHDREQNSSGKALPDPEDSFPLKFPRAS